MSNEFTSRWIWADAPIGRNMMALARGSFHLDKELACGAVVKIAADSKYVLYLNGIRIGGGPVRSWPWQRFYDEYDVTGLLHKGKNVLAAEVLCLGESTFQYIFDGIAGLSCQLQTDEGRVLCTSDRTWKAIMDSAYNRRSMRACIQLDYAQIFDARKRPGDWNVPGFDDSLWPHAKEMEDACSAKLNKIVRKTIPHLSDVPIYAKRAVSSRVIEPFGPCCYIWGKWFFVPGDTSQNQFHCNGIAATILNVPCATKASLRGLNNNADFYVNGKKVELCYEKESYFVQGVCDLKKGDNLVVIRIIPGQRDYFGFSIRIDDRDAVVKWISPDKNTENTSGWIISDCSPDGHYPLEAALVGFDSYSYPYDFVIEKAAACDCAEDLLAVLPHFTPIPDSAIVNQSALNDTADPVALDAKASIANFDAICEGAAETVTVISPASGDVELMIDFGTMFVGQFSFDIDAPAGTIIDIHAAEENYKGRQYYPSEMDNTVRYVAHAGRQNFRSFTRHGGRWVTVTLRNFKSPVKIFDFHVHLMTYPQSGKASFDCSDQAMSRIWELCRYTLRLCSEDTFTDCPTYERALWVGDARNESLLHYVLNGDSRLPQRCIKLAGDCVQKFPIVEAIGASGWRCIIPAWSFLWVKNCWEAYLYDSDKAFLAGMYPAIRKNFDAMRMYINANGLFEIDEWNFLDWTKDAMMVKGASAFSQGWYVNALNTAVKIAEELGCKEDAAEYAALAAQIKSQANKYFWDEKEGAYFNNIHNGCNVSRISQQTQVVMYLSDMAEGTRKERIQKNLLEPPAGWDKINTPFIMWFLLECLAREERFDEIMHLIRDKWFGMIRLGATSCLEAFPTPGQTRLCRSNCHAWSAAPGYFLPTYVLGIRPLTPGFGKILIAPKPADIKWANGAMPIPGGQVTVDWQIKSGEFVINFTSPQPNPVELIIPAIACKDVSPRITSESKYKTSLGSDGCWHVCFDAGGAVSARAVM